MAAAVCLPHAPPTWDWPGAEVIGGPPTCRGTLGPQLQVGGAPPARQSRGPRNFVPRKLCTYYETRGWCRKGDDCTFAHGVHELDPRVHQQSQPVACNDPAEQGVAAGCQDEQASLQLRNMLGVGTGQQPGAPGPPGQFQFSTQAVPFVPGGGTLNPDAVPFVPPTDFSAEAKPFVLQGPGNGTGQAMGNGSAPPGNWNGAQPQAAAAGVSGLDQKVSPGVAKALPGVARRRAPDPIVIDDAPPSQLSRPTWSQAPVASPTAASPSAAWATARVAPSPRASGVSLVPFGSPRASAGGGTSFGSIPEGAVVQQSVPCASPTARSPGGGLIGVTIPRGALLQGRTVARRLEKGPPGLAAFAPTPTSYARNLGFQLPQPGMILTEAAPKAAPRRWSAT